MWVLRKSIYGFRVHGMSTQQSIYEFVMQRLSARAIPRRKIAEDTGIPFSTVTKIAQRGIADPSVHTIQRLYDYFCGKDDSVFQEQRDAQ